MWVTMSIMTPASIYVRFKNTWDIMIVRVLRVLSCVNVLLPIKQKKNKKTLDFGPAGPGNWTARLKGKSKPTCGDCRGFVSSCVAVIQIRRARVCCFVLYGSTPEPYRPGLGSISSSSSFLRRPANLCTRLEQADKQPAAQLPSGGRSN